MGKEQESEHREESGKGLFAWVEHRWGSLSLEIKISLVAILLVGLVVIWFVVCPEFAQFLGYLAGGVFLLRQISISSQRAKAAEETAKAMQRTAELTEKGNIAERFKNAIEHLGHESASVHLGGIYALHHIAREVKEYREMVFEILCAHVRGVTTQEGYKPKIGPHGEEPSIEIESILKLLFLSREMVGRSIYSDSGLRANLENADLSGAMLGDVDLRKSLLWGTKLEGAFLPGANLEKALLQYANLQGAVLRGANLDGASFFKADLQETDLREVENLNPEQLFKTKILYMAKLPDGMEKIIRQHNLTLFEKPNDEQKT